MTEKITHIPVLLDELLNKIKTIKNGLLIDGTFGLGGYSRAFLENTNCKVFAIDRDPEVQKYAQDLSIEFKDRFSFSICNF